MAKFYGTVGYGFTSNKNTKPGVYKTNYIERNYYGDMIRISSRWQNGESINDDLTLNHQISIIADPFAYENYNFIRYVKIMGASWKVTSVEIQRPRIVLSIGGVFNE